MIYFVGTIVNKNHRKRDESFAGLPMSPLKIARNDLSEPRRGALSRSRIKA